jgi:hypothetical protein
LPKTGSISLLTFEVGDLTAALEHLTGLKERAALQLIELALHTGLADRGHS